MTHTMTDLIYCAKRNHFAKYAVEAGMLYGVQAPKSAADFPVYFVDLDPNHIPKREKYMAKVQAHKPALCTVPDVFNLDELDEALSWSLEASKHTSKAIIVTPKCLGVIERLPRSVNGLEIRLGYSIPTGHGKTDVPITHFTGWPVHLLGGNPLEQYRLAHPFIDAESGEWITLDVRSVDCNQIQLKAVKWAQFLASTQYPRKNSFYGQRPALQWKQLKDIGLGNISNAPYEAFRRSCESLVSAWKANE